MTILVSALERLSEDLDLIGEGAAADKVMQLSQGVKLAASSLPEIQEALMKAISKVDSKGLPAVYYLLSSGKVPRDLKRLLEDISSEALNKKVPVKNLLGLIKLAQFKINRYSQTLPSLENKEVFTEALENLDKMRLAYQKQALQGPEIDEAIYKGLPVKIDRMINQLGKNVDSIVITRGQKGIEEFLETYEKILDTHHILQNPSALNLRVPAPGGRSPSTRVISPFSELSKVESPSKKKEEPAKSPSAPQEKSKIVKDEKPSSDYSAKMWDKAKSLGKNLLEKMKEKKPAESPKESPKEAPKETPKETPKESPKEAPKEVSKKDTEKKPSLYTKKQLDDMENDLKNTSPSGEEDYLTKSGKPWEKAKKEKIKGTLYNSPSDWESLAKLAKEEKQILAARMRRMASHLEEQGESYESLISAASRLEDSM